MCVCYSSWQLRRIVYTDELIGFAKADDVRMSDVILLSEVVSVDEMLLSTGSNGASRPDTHQEKMEKMDRWANALKIETSPTGTVRAHSICLSLIEIFSFLSQDSI